MRRKYRESDDDRKCGLQLNVLKATSLAGCVKLSKNKTVFISQSVFYLRVIIIIIIIINSNWVSTRWQCSVYEYKKNTNTR
jgi:hypothetical protein